MDRDLVDRIYEAGAVPELWPDVLEDIQRISSAAASIMIAVGGEEPRWITTPPGKDLVENWHSFVGPDIVDNVRTTALLKQNYAGFLSDFDVLTDEVIQNAPLYRDFLRPAGYGYCVASNIPMPNGEQFILHFERLQETGPVERPVIERLDALRGHLARSVLLSARFGFERARAMTDAMASFNLAGAVVTRNGRLVAANDLLASLIPATVVDTIRHLYLVHAPAQELLEEALHRTAHPNGDAAVRSIPIPATSASPAMLVHIVPVRRTAHDIFTGADAILVFMPVTPGTAPDASVLQGLFDLTPSEALVTQGVVKGLTLAEIAGERGLHRTTVRNQLGNVFAKTGTNRQSDLVRLLRSTRPGP